MIADGEGRATVRSGGRDRKETKGENIILLLGRRSERKKRGQASQGGFFRVCFPFSVLVREYVLIPAKRRRSIDPSASTVHLSQEPASMDQLRIIVILHSISSCLCPRREAPQFRRRAALGLVRLSLLVFLIGQFIIFQSSIATVSGRDVC